jgi:dihydrofolate reductase
MRKLITAMKISVDGKYEGSQGYADWVGAWSDDCGLTPQVDACVLGGRMSGTVTSAAWPHTRFLRSLDDVGKLKLEPGKDIYLMGGGTIAAAAIDAGLVDEVRLLVYPLIAGEGRALFTSSATRRGLEPRKAEQLRDGRLALVYGAGSD